MATIMLYAGKINQMSGLIKEVKKSVTDYKSELSALQKKTLTINRRVCDLEDIMSSIQTSSQIQEGKITSLDIFSQNNEEFIFKVLQVDGDVVDIINQRKEDFYEEYYYLEPECKKSWKNAVKKWFASAGEWCKQHWKEITIGLVCIIVGAVLTALTGGAFLATLGAGLKAALVAGVISGVISSGISLISSVISGEKFEISLGKAINSFADGFASGFMVGGIMAGVSMTISAGFKIAAKLGASTGRSGGLGKDGLLKVLSPDRIASDGNGGGTLIKIGNTLRLDVDTRILQGAKYINPLNMANFLHLHIPGMTGNVPILLIVGGHIPIGLYSSSIIGAIFRKEGHYILNRGDYNNEK